MNMETRDIITAIIAVFAGLAFLFSIITFRMTFRQRANEERRSTRKALTDVVAELTKVNIAYGELELRYPGSVTHNVLNLRRHYNSQRRYLASHGEFLTGEIPNLTTDVDYVSLAFAFESVGDYEKAQKFYQVAIDKSPNNILKMWNLRSFARFWFAQGNAQLGRGAYEESLKLQLPDRIVFDQ